MDSNHSQKDDQSAQPVSPGTDLGVNAGLAAHFRERFDLNPRWVDPSWASYFSQGASAPAPPESAGTASVGREEADLAIMEGATAPTPPRSPGAGRRVERPAEHPLAERPPVSRETERERGESAPAGPSRREAPDVGAGPSGLEHVDPDLIVKHANVLRLIHSFRARGHRIADTDPLGGRGGYFPEVDPMRYGFTDDDLETLFIAGDLPGGPVQPLAAILATLRSTYCGYVGVEFTHIQDPDRKNWLIDRMEHTRNETQFSVEARLRILQYIARAELFERFVHTKFLGQKRFSLEGAESLIPLLNELVEHAPRHGIREYVIGMAHRGRLNVLSNIVGKSLESIFSEFEDTPRLDMPFGSGDVKYHKGFSSDRYTESGERVHLSLTSNPSHLEMVNPVVEGRARAKQVRAGDFFGHAIVPILIHGDAAFAGQGIVAETLNLSQLKGYSTGGTFHVIIDNQIGFTTTPAEARSTLYATDVAKMIQVPIFHVNGDKPEAVLHATLLAMAYRQRFHSDVVLNLVCYRRHGHNEGDEPDFTQPLLYDKIKPKTSVRAIYTEHLAHLGVLSDEDADRVEQELRQELSDALQRIKSRPPDPDEPYEPRGPWQGFSRTPPKREVETAISHERIDDLMRRASRLPSDFKVHHKLQKLLEKRLESLEKGEGLDWAFGEILAYASILDDKLSVRVSGQDSSRGTFSHRHAVFVDQESGEEYAPLAHLSAHQGRFEVYDSLLSEQAVLGFEYGYAVADPLTLVIWEAQFGDFANGAQCIIDQFISSAHVKWQRMNGLVMFLPHGYEGQGPEHSSARVERFLQLCAEQNMQVANCTTPAQIFHLLRRQMLRNYRAPLVVFTPKSLLRHPQAVSSMNDFTEGRFESVIPDRRVEAADQVRRVLICTGKVYYDLLATCEKMETRSEYALLRLEQMYPWPREVLSKTIALYPNAREFVWVQEEPANQGAWFFVRHRIEAELGSRSSLQYAGRPASASPAVGSARLHSLQQKKLVADALDIEFDENEQPVPRRRSPAAVR